MRRRVAPLFGLLLGLAGVALARPPAPTAPLALPFAPPISGVVRSVRSPVSGALVVFYNVGQASLTRSRTASDGTFVLASAPVGVYDLIAYKKGFLPALVRLWHQAAEARVSAVEIELAASERARTGAAAESSLWELQDRVPPDVLRDIVTEELGDGSGTPLDRVRLDRMIGGEVRTLAGVSTGDTGLSRTSLGVRGGLPNGWRYDLRGDYTALTDGAANPATTGNAAGLALDVAPSADQRVQLTSRRHSISFGDDHPASLSSHGVRWSRGDEQGVVESVGARYIEEAGLYRATALGTSFFPLASRTWEVNGAYSRPAGDTPGVSVAMAYRHREGTVGLSGVGAEGAFFAASPDADLSASTSVRVSSRGLLEGGVVARTVGGGYGIAPRLVASYEVAPRTFVFVRGLYRVSEAGTSTGTVMPRVASIEDNGEPASRHGYAAGLEWRGGRDGSFRVEGSVQQMDEVVRAFFDGDFLTDLDSVYLLDGNTVRQYQASGRRRLTDDVAGTMSARYGEIGGDVAAPTAASYGISNSRGHFWSAKAAVEILPTHTGIALVVRGVRQALGSGSSNLSNDSDKIGLSLAQDLSVVGVTPFGSICKLLFALESTRNTASAERDDSPMNNRLLGGVALAF